MSSTSLLNSVDTDCCFLLFEYLFLSQKNQQFDSEAAHELMSLCASSWTIKTMQSTCTV